MKLQTTDWALKQFPNHTLSYSGQHIISQILVRLVTNQARIKDFPIGVGAVRTGQY
jgi:hypothetical protein